jgi:hypothetical protein
MCLADTSTPTRLAGKLALPFKGLQKERLIRFHDAGFLLRLVSRNERQDAVPP